MCMRQGLARALHVLVLGCDRPQRVHGRVLCASTCPSQLMEAIRPRAHRANHTRAAASRCKEEEGSSEEASRRLGRIIAKEWERK